MQPTYLPWCGYFHIASKVDTFVFLDDVQFERRSWQSRNYILSQGKTHLLVVPVKQAKQQTPIKDIFIADDSVWKKKHLRSIQFAYPVLWHNHELREKLIEAIEEPCQTLSDLNIKLIRLMLNFLNIKCRTVKASDLGCGGKRSEHLANICQAVKANKYISPIGSRLYLEKDNFQEHYGISLHYCEFIPNFYFQPKTHEFVSHLSVLDVIGHYGIDVAENYVKNNVFEQNIQKC
jgi:hypothetical protein